MINQKTNQMEFAKIPMAPSYEVSKLGMVRNAKTKKIVAGKGSVRLWNGKENVSFKVAELIQNAFGTTTSASKPVATPKASTKKEPSPKGPKKARDGSVAAKIREMHKAGKSQDEIEKALGITKGHYVGDVIWRMKNPGGKKGA